jgi:fimbrial chaperone protein
MAAQSRLTRGLGPAVVSLGLAFGMAGRVFAASYAVEPSTVTLAPPVRNATLTLTNLSQEPIRFQVQGLAWTESDAGATRLMKTPDVVVFPQLFTIPPLGTQRVRAAIVAPPSSTEQTFRIVIEDLPPLGETLHAAPGERITMRTRFTVALYVEPAVRAPAWRIESPDVHDGLLTFAVLNTGNTHLAGDSLFVSGRDASGKTVVSSEIAEWHVLAGERHVYTLEIGKATCVRKLTISPGTVGMPPADTVDVAACT